MQTGKFTIFDFDQLQDPTKQEKYQDVISWATTVKNTYMKRVIVNYDYQRTDKINLNLPISWYIQKANEVMKQKWNSSLGYVPLKTANEKMLFMTTFVFSDNQNFLSTLKRYGIEKESCLNFGEEIKQLYSCEMPQRATTLELLMQEYFPNLNQVKTYYGTNNTGIIINKVLEIAYLHPELLHTKEKS